MKSQLIPAVMGDCTYGIKSAEFGKVFWGLAGIIVTITVTIFAWTLLAWYILWKARRIIGETAVVIVCVPIPLIIDIIARNFPTWKYFGPGTEYIRGTTGNRWISTASLMFLIGINLLVFLFSCIFLSGSEWLLGSVFINPNAENEGESAIKNKGNNAQVSSEEPDEKRESNRIRVCLEKFLARGGNGGKPRYTMPSEIIAFLLVNSSSVLTTIYLWKYGALSYYSGNEADSLNMENCSGPEAWVQTNNWTRAALVLPFVLWIPKLCLGILGFLTDLALLTVSSIATAEEDNPFYKSFAVSEIVYSCISLFKTVYYFSRTKYDGQN